MKASNCWCFQTKHQTLAGSKPQPMLQKGTSDALGRSGKWGWGGKARSFLGDYEIGLQRQNKAKLPRAKTNCGKTHRKYQLEEGEQTRAHECQLGEEPLWIAAPPGAGNEEIPVSSYAEAFKRGDSPTRLNEVTKFVHQG